MKHPNYRGARTQAEADAILADYPLPPGWRLVAVALRTWKYRSEWALGLWKGQQLELRYRVYDLGGAAHVAQAHAERQARSVVVTADLDGWVKSIEDVA